MNILFIDTETTGLDPETHGILELAAQLYSDGKLIDTFNQAIKIEDLVANGRSVAIDALKVNGITFYNQGKVCMERGIDFLGKEEEVLRNFVDWLVGATLKVDGKIFVAGQNVAFDLGFIKKSLSRNKFEGWDRGISYRNIDTSDISRFLIDTGVLRIPSELPSGSGLEKTALALGIEVRGRQLHTALEDVKLTAEVYYAMKDRVEKLCQLDQKQN